MPGAVRTTCPYCGVGCGLKAARSDGGWKIEPDEDHPSNYGRICAKGASLHETIDLEGRLLHPRMGGSRVDWDTALGAVADRFRAAIDRHGPDSVAFYVSGQLLTEDYYVANKLMKGFIGSGNIDTNSRLCMSSAVAGHQRAFGEDLVPGCYQDVEQADLAVIVGGNTAWCHPVLFQRIQAVMERRTGMRLIVIDPRRTATASAADLHLPVKPGTDVALFNGLFAYLDRRGLADEAFIASSTLGVEAARRACAAFDIDRVAACCDLDRRSVERFYRWFARTERVVTLFSQGVNQSSAGTDKVNAIINCHLLTNRIGKIGSGPFSLTGQPNAMGGREVGGLASTLAAHMGFDAASIERVRRFWRSPAIAGRPGLTAVELFRRMEAGGIKAVWIMATNPVVSLPDADAVRRALRACEFVAVSDCSARTDTTQHAGVLLPAAAWGEKDGTVTNSERRISRQRAFLPLPEEARPDWWIICEVAKRMGYAKAFAYESPAQIFAEHARLSAFENGGERRFDISGMANLSAAEYDALEPLQWPVTARKPGGTARLFALSDYPAPDGRARFVPLTPRGPANPVTREHPLVLNTGRVRDHWHTLTRTGKSPRLSSHLSEPFVAVHSEDAAKLGLQDRHLAEVGTRWGGLIARVCVDDGQRPGEIFVPMHWSDQFSRCARVGALANPVVDPVSGEPEFKSTPARAGACNMAWYGFLLMRSNPRPEDFDGLDYWAKVRGRDHWRLEIAGRELPGSYASWAKRLLGVTTFGADWLEFIDARAGSYRVAGLDAGGRLEACLMLGPHSDALPERSWLGRLFSKSVLDGSDRMTLLAGTGADSSLQPTPVRG